MTRWSVADLTGKLMKAQKEPKSRPVGSDRVPRNITIRQTSMARILETRRIRSGESICSYYQMERTVSTKSDSRERAVSLNGMVERVGEGRPPPLHHVIQSYDTAFMKKETSDYSAITTWGVFYPTRTADRRLSWSMLLKNDTSFQNYDASPKSNMTIGNQNL
ncbi:MAG: hypothetical protein CM15mV53_240 [uncultured marine virus]|nr:MAG: hypothetical protein CM15mV53_240 [uncultured marine virus]